MSKGENNAADAQSGDGGLAGESEGQGGVAASPEPLSITLAESCAVKHTVPPVAASDVAPALTGVVALLSLWRTRPSFRSYGFAANSALMVGGFLLAGIQMVGFVLFS